MSTPETVPPSGPNPGQPKGCGTAPGQPLCPPVPAAIALQALYTYDEMLAHGAACYEKGRLDSAQAKPEQE